ncbi:MAG: hypothetical protein IT355_12435 [Gemmatimonadaceae bacterium]|nr:hypothetical protein [Gemmatimonadaceae bacterium]
MQAPREIGSRSPRDLMRTLAVCAGIAACTDGTAVAPGAPVARSTSVMPALVKRLPAGVMAYTVISSADSLPGSPRFAGAADGTGLLRNGDGTFTLLTNHEVIGAVSRVTLDHTFAPVSLDYVVRSAAGIWRRCSATLATVAEHGFGPLFLSGIEGGIESVVQAVDPRMAPRTAPDDGMLRPALGRWSAEQVLPLPGTAYPGRTVILIGDDDGGANGGQLAMYVGDAVGDLAHGTLYVLARADDNTREMDMTTAGGPYTVQFRPVPNGATTTGAQVEAAGAAQHMMRFGRVEDIDYRKGTGGGRELYFNVTGQAATGVNADASRSVHGRTYRLVLDAGTPLRGTLHVLLDGDDRSGPARLFQNPDNIVAGTNHLYIQEDPHVYGDETHDAYIYQYALATGVLRVVLELDHRRDTPVAEPWGGAATPLGSWEFGAMIDVSAQTGIRDAFLLAIQPHGWRDGRFLRLAGSHPDPVIDASENQGSQLVLLTGLPR